MKEGRHCMLLHTQQDAITQSAFHLEEKQTQILPAVLGGGGSYAESGGCTPSPR